LLNIRSPVMRIHGEGPLCISPASPTLQQQFVTLDI
jgi:hypothetical protein